MIPFIELKRNQAFLNEIARANSKVIQSGQWLNGKEVNSFEREFAHCCGKRYCIGVSSGTDALVLALKSLEIKSGDEVITAVNTASPTAVAITLSKATPRFVDVREDFLIDPTKIEEAITKKTRAIIPVHLYGQSCDMDPILDIAKKHEIKVIEDCCQAHRTEYFSKKVPIGDIGCFSFYPSKNLFTNGDGGGIVTNNQETEMKIRSLKQYGWDLNNQQICVLKDGINSRLSEIQASTLRVCLKTLGLRNEERRKIAKLYTNSLEEILTIPLERDYGNPVYHLYVIQHEKRDELQRHLGRNGIQTKVHYPLPLHLHPVFKQKYRLGDFPKAEKFSKKILSLPIFPDLREEEIDFIIKSIKEF